MRFLLQTPIIVDLARQPDVSPGITYPQVILGAAGVAGVIMLVAASVGLATGAVIIYFKKRANASATTETGHATLNIGT